ncbi:Undecaprenyl diphosphate synthase [Amniculicola lignicola CBS 123094]|uniref:ditrans,polycis-polyprenyl diphosphate synthase [(2E,6E)-farnesyldiphosphate specific] n=1 Tax=Amniculicola lignicola CBS 123094 TaxID=1392246 RepID=A0A6A5WC88_9PLEO|nr:Undecaprenyl diphosphate synthase [Amniculicola lignicola CBS 123094]
MAPAEVPAVTAGVGPKETVAFRKGTIDGRKQLTAKEREALMDPYLPRKASPAPDGTSSRLKQHKRKEGLLRTFIYISVYRIVSFIFSVFFRFRRSWRLVTGKAVAVLKHHHRTPEFIQRDVKHLERLPKHLSVILDFDESDENLGHAGLEGLTSDVCEIAAWTASAGIPLLSVYEKSGKLKNYMPQLHKHISQTLEAYFGPRRKPTLSVRAPHLQSYSPPNTPPLNASPDAASVSPSRSATPKSENGHLNVLLLSSVDGRGTIIDLTKTLSEMVQKGAIEPSQVDSNLIDQQLVDAVSDEPDLLVLFSPTVQLKGYPPWQLRLTEIFHLPDNKGVNYQVFLRALYNFAKVEMRLGR